MVTESLDDFAQFEFDRGVKQQSELLDFTAVSDKLMELPYSLKIQAARCDMYNGFPIFVLLKTHNCFPHSELKF